MMQNLRDHVMQLARQSLSTTQRLSVFGSCCQLMWLMTQVDSLSFEGENWDLKNRGGFVEEQHCSKLFLISDLFVLNMIFLKLSRAKTGPWLLHDNPPLNFKHKQRKCRTLQDDHRASRTVRLQDVECAVDWGASTFFVRPDACWKADTCEQFSLPQAHFCHFGPSCFFDPGFHISLSLCNII